MLIYVWKNTVVDARSIEQIWDDGKSDDGPKGSWA